MFIDINRNKRPKKPKYYLAKPNKEVISNLTGYKRDDSCSFKLGNINELSFTIPYYIEKDFELTYNKDIDLVKEKMLIKMSLGADIEWFIIDEIEENGDDAESMSITAYSLGHELSHKRVSFYQVDSVNAKQSLKDIIESEDSPTPWKVGDIDTALENVYRSFDATDSNALEMVFQIAETFDAIVEWDTINRRVSMRVDEKDADKDIVVNGKYKGLTINYGKLLRSLTRNRATDEMVTRLYVYGNEDLSINNVNPTGQSYLEDFTYFMYPFERDENRNVLKSSAFMSDELCHAILDYNELITHYTPQFKTLTEEITTLNTRYINEETLLEELNSELFVIQNNLDVAKSLNDTGLITSLIASETAKLSEISQKKNLLDSIEKNIDTLHSQIDAITASVNREANFTSELVEELNLYVIEKEFRDDRYIDEQELYDDAVKKFKELREPKVAISLDIEDFLEIIEEQHNWDKLKLGDYVKVKYPQMNIEYIAKIIEIDYDFENTGISITIANTKKLSELDKLNKVLYESKMASTLIANNKYKWDKVDVVSDEVWKLLNQEWDANKNKIIAGVNNLIEIGKRGIIITSPSNPDEMIIIQSGIIALSRDKGFSWKTAIRPDGIVAETLIGNIIIGRNLVMTNSSGKFSFDENGVVIEGTSLTITGGLPKEQIEQEFVREMEELNTSFTQFESNVESMFSDSSLTTIEANSLRLSLSQLIAESTYLIQLATSLKITTTKNNYSNALNDLKTYLETNFIGDFDYPLDITATQRQTIDTKFKTVQSTKTALVNDVSLTMDSNAKNYADEVSNVLSGEIFDINEKINEVDAYIDGSFKDGIIEESEAKAIATYINQLNVEKSDLDNKYAVIYSDAKLTGTVKSTLLTKKTSYDTAHNNLILAINTAISDRHTTETEKANVDSKFALYRTALGELSTALENAVREITQSIANIAEENAKNNAKSYADNLKAQIDSEVEDINDRLNDFNEFIGDSFRDGIIEESEAKAIATYINSLNVEKADLDNRYTNIYNDSNLTGTPKTTLNSKKTAYDTAHQNLINSINTAIRDEKASTDEANDVNVKFALYKTTIGELANAIQLAITSISQVMANKAESNSKTYTDSMRQAINLEITDINSRIADLDSYIGEAFLDGIIEESEAKAIATYINSLNTEKLDLDNGYAVIYNNTNLTGTPKTTLATKKTAYDTSYNNLISSINTAIRDGKTTSDEKTDVDTKFTSYRTALGELSTAIQNAITSIAQAMANSAETKAKSYADSLKLLIDSEIADVMNRLEDIGDAIEETFADGIIEQSEAKAIEKYINSLSTEKLDLDNRYNSVYANANLADSPQKTTLATKKTAYDTAHTNLINSINTAISDGKATLEEKSNVDAKFKTYATALGELSSAIENAINFIAQVIDYTSEIERWSDALNYAYKFMYEKNSQYSNISSSSYLTQSDKNILKNSKDTYEALFYALNTIVNNVKNKGFITDSDRNAYNNSLNELDNETENYSNIIEYYRQLIVTNGDTNIRNDLRLTAPLPTNIKMDSSGITASTTSNADKFAKMDYRGLYVQGGALDIRTDITSSTKGMQINGDGLTAYDANGTLKFKLDASTGNVTMNGGSISWGAVNTPTISYDNITGSKPPINADSTSSVIGSKLTKITSDGVYTGTVSATQISAGTLYGMYISGGNINVSTDAYIGNNLYLGNYSDGNTYKSIYFSNKSSIDGGNDTSTGKNTLSFRTDSFTIRLNGSSSYTGDFIMSSTHLSMYASTNIYLNTRTIDLFASAGGVRVTGTIYQNGTSLDNTYASRYHSHSEYWEKGSSSGALSSNVYVTANSIAVGGTFDNSNSTSPSTMSIGANSMYVPSNVYVGSTVRAKGVTLTSSREYKKNISQFNKTVLNEIIETPIYKYNFETELDSELPHVGIMLQEAPIECVSPDGGVDIYGMVALSWKAHQETNAVLEGCRERIEILESLLNQYTDRVLDLEQENTQLKSDITLIKNRLGLE